MQLGLSTMVGLLFEFEYVSVLHYLSVYCPLISLCLCIASIVLHLMLSISSKLMSGCPNSAVPLTGNTKNLHVKALSLIHTMHVPNCMMFDLWYVFNLKCLSVVLLSCSSQTLQKFFLIYIWVLNCHHCLSLFYLATFILSTGFYLCDDNY